MFETISGINLRVSHNGGRTFSSPQTVIRGSDPGYVDPSCPLRPTVGVRQRSLKGPRVTFDRRGDIHVVAAMGAFLDTGNAQQGLEGEAVVHHAVVHHGHAVLDEAVTPPTTDEQWAATVASLPDGGVAVSWLQTNAPGFATYDAWIAAKPAGARRFAAPQRLSPTSSTFPAAMEAEGNSSCYGVGDYIGMVATRSGVATVWPTTDGATPGVDSDVLLRPAHLV